MDRFAAERGGAAVSSDPRPAFGPPMTLGAAAGVRLIVWCKACRHRVEPDPAEMAERYGAEMPVLNWRARLVCGEVRVAAGRYGRERDRRRAQTKSPAEAGLLSWSFFLRLRRLLRNVLADSDRLGIKTEPM